MRWLKNRYGSDADYYLHQGERSEHWRRLRDWSFCSGHVYMYFKAPYLYNGAR